MSELTVNGTRLWASLMDLARIGATPGGGVCRVALTDADRRGRDWLIEQARTLGLRVSIDVLGNMFLRRPGRTDGPPVMMGSHIDSQPNGGKFDGTFGVLAALEVCRVLNEARVETLCPIDVVTWTNEEGCRFVPVMAGSGVFAGVYDAATVLNARASDGVRFADELSRIGYDGSAPAAHGSIAAYFEAHIEQGPVLEAGNCTIGVVNGALGVAWFSVEITGFEAHAGPTLMPMRRDALTAAAEIIGRIESIGCGHPDARSTVGMIEAWPNSRNVIPGRVRFSVDLRHLHAPALDAMVAEFKEEVGLICARRNVAVEITPTSAWPPMHFDTSLVDMVRAGASRRGYTHLDLASGAGHDAVLMARICPTAMIFIPCKDGVSHNEIEDAQPEHVTAGANVLLDCVLARASQPSEDR